MTNYLLFEDEQQTKVETEEEVETEKKPRKRVGNPVQVNFEILDTQYKVNRLLPILMSQGAWGLDFETTGVDPIVDKIIMCQIGRPDKQYVMDTRQVSVEPLRPFFESKEIKKIAHNAIFEYQMAKMNWGIELEALRCTQIAERVITAGTRYVFNLASVAHDRLGIVMDKDLQKSFIGMKNETFTQEQFEYGAGDVVYMNTLLESQTKDIMKEGLENTYLLECDFIPCLGDMQLNGIKLDVNLWKKTIEENIKKRDELIDKMDQIASAYVTCDLSGKPDINYGSPVQIVNLLQLMRIKYNEYDPKTKKETVKIIDKSDDKTFKKIIGKHQILDLIQDYRTQCVLINTFGEPYIKAIHPVTGRIQTSFEQIGADTGRLTKGRDSEVNLLNLPQDSRFRRGFVAKPDYVIETDDYSGCELRILAEYTEDPKFTHAFLNGIDAHCMVASDLYRVPVTKTNENKRLRKPAKALNFGWLIAA